MVNNTDRVTRIANDAEVTKRQAAKALDALVDGVQEALSKGDSIILRGFGMFSVLGPRSLFGGPRVGQA